MYNTNATTTNDTLVGWLARVSAFERRLRQCGSHVVLFNFRFSLTFTQLQLFRRDAWFKREHTAGGWRDSKGIRGGGLVGGGTLQTCWISGIRNLSKERF